MKNILKIFIFLIVISGLYGCTKDNNQKDKEDNIPEIKLLGESEVSIFQGTEYIDQGATASDKEDGDISGQIVASGISDIKVDELGDYVIKYTVVDSKGNSATEVTRTVHVVDDLSLVFTDDNFENLIRQTIDKPSGPLKIEDVESIARLEGENLGISDISGIEYLSNLSRLTLANNNISDISKLKDLSKLRILVLNNNSIKDISSIGSLTKLRSVNLSNNEINDISSLNQSKDIELLILNNNLITDITSLSNLSNLWKLELDNNLITDITPLSNSNISNLIKLSVKNNNLVNVSILRDMYENGTFSKIDSTILIEGNPLDLVDTSDTYQALKTVYENGIELDIGLRTFTDDHGDGKEVATEASLNSSYAGELDYNLDEDWFVITLEEEKDIVVYTLNGFNSYETIYNENLEVIACNNHNTNKAKIATTLSPGTYYINVKSIRSHSNPVNYNLYIEEIELDSNSPTVTFYSYLLRDKISEILDKEYNTITEQDLEMFIILDLHATSGWDISNISDLRFFKNLQYLNLNENEVSDLSPISNLTNLKYLFLYNNNISDISPLSSLVNLEYLMLCENQIGNINALRDLVNLYSLNLSCNEIVDISALGNLNNLQHLYIGENQIQDISPLENLINLTELRLNKNQITDITSLSNLTNIKLLILDNNNISDISTLENMVNLKSLYLDTNNISDITPIHNMINLVNLSLSKNNIVDISVLKTLYDNGAFHDENKFYDINISTNSVDYTEGTDAYNTIQYLEDKGLFVCK